MSKRKNKYVISDAEREVKNREFELFRKNAALILEHQDAILTCRDYFFVPLAFAGYSCAYVVGDGPLCLGHLLLAWLDGLLIEPCKKCGGSVRVVSFGGSPLSGSTAWSGFCMTCDKSINDTGSVHAPFIDKIKLMMALHKAFPIKVSGWVEEDSKKFCWGGNGLEPAKKRVWREAKTAEPVTLETLVNELQNGKIRKSKKPNVSLLRNKIVLKFTKISGREILITTDAEF